MIDWGFIKGWVIDLIRELLTDSSTDCLADWQTVTAQLMDWVINILLKHFVNNEADDIAFNLAAVPAGKSDLIKIM